MGNEVSELNSNANTECNTMKKICDQNSLTPSKATINRLLCKMLLVVILLCSSCRDNSVERRDAESLRELKSRFIVELEAKKFDTGNHLADDATLSEIAKLADEKRKDGDLTLYYFADIFGDEPGTGSATVVVQDEGIIDVVITNPEW